MGLEVQTSWNPGGHSFISQLPVEPYHKDGIVFMEGGTSVWSNLFAFVVRGYADI